MFLILLLLLLIAGEFEYSFTGGNTAGHFHIDPLSGLISVSGLLDRETTLAYVLEVTATDKGASPMSGTTTVSVTVDDINDNTPTCTPAGYAMAVAENTATATTVSHREM